MKVLWCLNWWKGPFSNFSTRKNTVCVVLWLLEKKIQEAEIVWRLRLCCFHFLNILRSIILKYSKIPSVNHYFGLFSIRKKCILDFLVREKCLGDQPRQMMNLSCQLTLFVKDFLGFGWVLTKTASNTSLVPHCCPFWRADVRLWCTVRLGTYGSSEK